MGPHGQPIWRSASFAWNSDNCGVGTGRGDAAKYRDSRILKRNRPAELAQTTFFCGGALGRSAKRGLWAVGAVCAGPVAKDGPRPVAGRLLGLLADFRRTVARDWCAHGLLSARDYGLAHHYGYLRRSDARCTHRVARSYVCLGGYPLGGSHQGYTPKQQIRHCRRTTLRPRSRHWRGHSCHYGDRER